VPLLSAKCRTESAKHAFFSGNSTHRAISNWLAEGARRKLLYVRAFLALRQLFPLAEGAVLSSEATLRPQTSARS
jgi:hypothetical protein